MTYMINDSQFLFEANVVNAGKESVVIYDADGNELDYINTFDYIMDRFIKDATKGKLPAVEQWMMRNFKKWIKKGAQDPDNQMADEHMMQRLFFVPLHDYIETVLAHESNLVQQGKLSEEIIMNSFPDFVKANPSDAVVFSGGRLFRLRRLKQPVEELVDFLNQTQADRNDVIMPPTFMVKNLERLAPPEGFKMATAWHAYTVQQAEKVSREQGLQMVKDLKEGTDFKILEKFENSVMVKLLSEQAAHVEGTIMKHCVASYGRDIANGSITIYSFRDKDFLPVATIEMRGKEASQVKGKHNGPVAEEFHKDIQSFFEKYHFSPGHDGRHIGWDKRKAHPEDGS